MKKLIIGTCGALLAIAPAFAERSNYTNNVSANTISKNDLEVIFNSDQVEKLHIIALSEQEMAETKGASHIDNMGGGGFGRGGGFNFNFSSPKGGNIYTFNNTAKANPATFNNTTIIPIGTRYGGAVYMGAPKVPTDTPKLPTKSNFGGNNGNNGIGIALGAFSGGFGGHVGYTTTTTTNGKFNQGDYIAAVASGAIMGGMFGQVSSANAFITAQKSFVGNAATGALNGWMSDKGVTANDHSHNLKQNNTGLGYKLFVTNQHDHGK